MKKIVMTLMLILLALLVPSAGMGASASLMPSPKIQLLDNLGNPLAGGKVYTCKAGVTCGPSTPLSNRKATYTDSTAITTNANPVVLDSAGRANIWLQGFYKISLYTSAGVLVYSVDNVSSAGAAATSGWTIDADSAGGIEATVAAIGSTSITMTVTSNQAVTNDLIIPANISTMVYKGNLITPAAGKTVAINGPVQAGPYQIFDQSSGGTITVTTYPQDDIWWGSTEHVRVNNLTVISSDITIGGSSVMSTLSTASPTGSIVMWPTETPPTGWLMCNGASVLRASYPGLFALIGTVYGAADSTHFNLPDLRGRFVRGWNNGASGDPDASTRTAVTTTGATMTAGDHVGTEQAAKASGTTSDGSSATWSTYPDGNPYVYSRSTHTHTFSATGDVRPPNTSMAFIIKY